MAAEDERDASQRENQRRRADTIGEPRARRVINNRALAPAPRVVPASLSLLVLVPFFPRVCHRYLFLVSSADDLHRREHRLRPLTGRAKRRLVVPWCLTIGCWFP